VTLIGAETLDDVPALVVQNTTLHLYAGSDGSLVDLDANRWCLTNS
jgi:hypothetical protein